MRADVQALVDDIRYALQLLRRHLDWDVALSRLDELNALSASHDLWENPEKAQALMKEKNRLEQKIEEVRSVETILNDNLEMIELAEEEGDNSLIVEAYDQIENLAKEAKKLQLQSLLSGEADENDAYLEVNAGAGGTEACDWAGMLLRMYVRWAESHGYKVSYLDETEGDGAGIKSTMIKIEGARAYGWLKHESGVHRLVRISPFDSNARRHTSFASVAVSPVVDDNIEIEILEKDLRVDTFRASGAGGQHVNRTDSAVRITHNPTGVVVSCQAQRSQHQNRAAAMEVLKARLYDLELKKREAVSDSQYDSKSDIGWGHQIRSYVLQPYQMIKDLRTGVERTDAQIVLDGDLDDFMHASLALKLSEATFGGADRISDIS
ncbi:MAG: peptide chain release factor 2 [Alphaproteobacteria bacterium]|nr:peptide chain release factor 2 [Alphaproteobacteria bacterium]MCB9984449.1 peptide chain release factor 2 [Micavibrio sp.]